MVDMSRVGEMPEPELNLALAGLGRKIDDMDEDIDAFDLLLLKASHRGLESPTYVLASRPNSVSRSRKGRIWCERKGFCSQDWLTWKTLLLTSE
jgi:hypothetical protein